MSSDPEGEAPAAHAPAARHPDHMHRILVTAIALTIAFALTYIPAPGINLDALNAPDGILAFNSGGLARLSIAGLWFSPVLSALLFTEALKLIVPPQSALDVNNRAQYRALTRFMIVLALCLAAFQAYGLTAAFEQISAVGGIPVVDEPGTAFRVTYMVTQTASAALLIALADVITRHGIGSGFWVIIAAGELQNLLGTVAAFVANYQSGMIAPPELFAVLAVTLAAIAVTAALYRAYAARQDGDGAPLSASDILIPAFLGAAFAQLLYAVALPLGSLTAGGDGAEYGYRPDDPLLLVLIAIITPLVMLLRTRKPFSALDRDRGRRTDRTPALVTGMATALITIAFNLLSAWTSAPLLSGPLLIAIVLIVLSAMPASLAPLLPHGMTPSAKLHDSD